MTPRVAEGEGRTVGPSGSSGPDPRHQEHRMSQPNPFTSTFSVTGMTSGGCVTSVTEGVCAIPGVVDVGLVLETGALTIDSSEPMDAATVRAAVEGAGYALA